MQSPIFILVDMQLISPVHHGRDQFARQTARREQQHTKSRNDIEHGYDDEISTEVQIVRVMRK